MNNLTEKDLKKLHDIIINVSTRDVTDLLKHGDDNLEFKNDLGFDSIEVIDIIMQCENEFKILISDTEAIDIIKISDLIKIIADNVNYGA